LTLSPSSGIIAALRESRYCSLGLLQATLAADSHKEEQFWGTALSFEHPGICYGPLQLELEGFMKQALLVLLTAIFMVSGCAAEEAQLQRDSTNSNAEVFIYYMNEHGYGLVKPELIWSSSSLSPTGSSWGYGFVGVSPDGSIYVAPQEYILYKIENGKAVQAGDYRPPNFGGAWSFSYSPDGTLYFAGNVGSVGTVYKVVNGRIGYDTVYYQRQFISEEPYEYIRGFGFGPDGTLYFTDGSAIYRVGNGTEMQLYVNDMTKKTGLDTVGSIAIDSKGIVYFTSQVYFSSDGGGWGGYGPSGEVYSLNAGKEKPVVAAITDEARGVAVGPDNSFYVLSWTPTDGSNNLLRLWRITLEQQILQTNATQLQAYGLVSNRTGYVSYVAANGTVSEFQGGDNTLSCVIAGEEGSSTEVLIGIPKACIKHPSQVSIEVDGTKLGGHLVESKTMYFVVFSYTQTQHSAKLTMTW